MKDIPLSYPFTRFHHTYSISKISSLKLFWRQLRIQEPEVKADSFQFHINWHYKWIQAPSYNFLCQNTGTRRGICRARGFPYLRTITTSKCPTSIRSTLILTIHKGWVPFWTPVQSHLLSPIVYVLPCVYLSSSCCPGSNDERPQPNQYIVLKTEINRDEIKIYASQMDDEISNFMRRANRMEQVHFQIFSCHNHQWLSAAPTKEQPGWVYPLLQESLDPNIHQWLRWLTRKDSTKFKYARELKWLRLKLIGGEVQLSIKSSSHKQTEWGKI